MRVFMLGWEFPPFISGGLGTACYGLTKAMSGLGTDIMFVLPRPVSTPFSTHVRLVSPHQGSPLAVASTEFRLDEFERVTFRTIDSQMTDPYSSPEQYAATKQRLLEEKYRGTQEVAADAGAGAVRGTAAPARTVGAAGGMAPAGGGDHYAGDLFSEIQRYATLASEIARQESFDVVHAHDWMTFPAGLAVAAMKGVPLVVHVHSTEFDRSGINVDSRIYDIERRGMHGAMKVIAVSYLTKTLCTHHYGIAPEKVEVVYNAIETNGNGFDEEKYKIHTDEKIVLFLGRITMQKGPEYFLGAAKKVLDVMDNVKFVMAGSGDMIRRTIEMASAMGIGHKVLFTGFLRGGDVDRVFKMADLYVMPSVSEPFGIAPLEAMSHDVPVIISKQSGVSEVLTHALKVDFWDINEMANKIIAVLKHPPLASTLRQHGSFEVRKLSWTDAARRCVEVYDSAIHMMNGKR
ncbi:MAG TPA: glycosyltransferase [Tepidisphaeraceae bacterium]|jgi:glycosyltransferase involved in cell wall biosynthesis